ncbi:MAG TPA: sigma-54-dependent Fis family transcriptional regulator [Desulfobulbus sp.]|nr:sigma-54-dependent Fis family transcriptional regulator [Desulfobulbus sp.]
MHYTILAVDDEINSLKVLSAALSSDKFTVDTAISGEEGFAMFKDKHYDLVLSDYKMPGMTGEQFLEKVKTVSPETPFVLLTAYGTIELAVNAMRLGAYTYLTKPVDLNLLENIINELLLTDRQEPDDGISGRSRFLNIIGKSKPMQEVFSLIRRVSKTDANILILGESGTGKELVARAIHYSSLRVDKPFIPIDCTTIPSELMESELFGYERGAFTGAMDRKIGLIEMAQGGTLFLDEIGDLELALEKKLLRFLQEREIRRVGGKKKIQVDVRVLSATNRDIEKEVERGGFRPDLFYRLNVITIRIPPLRKRKEDIPILAKHYLEYFNKKNKKNIRGFDSVVLEIMKNYDWPGNVRELENIVERAVILCSYDSINVECLPCKLQVIEDESCEECNELNLPEMEKRIIRKALDCTSWNQSKAAILLGISRKQLRTKMKNTGLMHKR